MRRTGIGASEAPILLDCDGYGRTPFWLYQNKTGGWITPANDAMELGNLLESGVLAFYRRKYGVELSSPGTLRHPHHSHALATPDAVVIDHGVPIRNVQVKCLAGHKARLLGPLGDHVPDHFRVQVEQEMEVANLPETDLVVLIGGVDVRVIRIPRSDVGAMVAELCDAFWTTHIETRQPPPVDGSPEAMAYLYAQYERADRADGAQIVESLADETRERVIASAERVIAADLLLKHLESIREKELQQIQSAMDGHSVLHAKSTEMQWTAAWQSRKGSIDWQAYAQSLGGNATQAEAFRRAATTSFSFRPKGSMADPSTRDSAWARSHALSLLGLIPDPTTQE